MLEKPLHLIIKFLFFFILQLFLCFFYINIDHIYNIKNKNSQIIFGSVNYNIMCIITSSKLKYILNFGITNNYDLAKTLIF